MLQFCLLGSGSSGNAALIRTPRARVLIDNGFSYKELRRRVEATGLTLDGLDAIFVTHEHIDHVNGLGVLARKQDAPVYMTRDTFSNLPDKVGVLPRLVFFEAGEQVRVGDLNLASFSVSHDAADPVSYTVESERGTKVGFATDLGHTSHLVRTRLAACHALVLEANYCPNMLLRSPYPPRVRQRIQSRIGHLSNQDMSSLLHQLLHDALQLVVLFHVSENNNDYELAHQMALGVLRNHPARLHVARQDEPTPLFEVAANGTALLP